MLALSQIEDVLQFYKCPCKATGAREGGGYIDYFLSPINGTTLNKLNARVNDLGVALGQAVQIALENMQIILRVKDQQKIYNYFDYSNNLEKITGQLAIGINPRGEYVQYNLFKMPHLLVAGATGSGKSVFLHNVIISLLDKNIDLRLIDLKRVELSRYNGLNNLISDTVTEAEQAARVLELEVDEMQRRYKTMEQYNARNYSDLPANVAFNARVIFIDELADLMLNRDTRRSVENSVVRIAQLGRAAGVHLVLATQRPSTNVITGLIKANIPCKVAFMTSNAIDARVIGCKGAENLSGCGDALLSIAGRKELERVQAFYIDDQTLNRFIDQLKEIQPKPTPQKQERRGFFSRLFN